MLDSFLRPINLQSILSLSQTHFLSFQNSVYSSEKSHFAVSSVYPCKGNILKESAKCSQKQIVQVVKVSS